MILTFRTRIILSFVLVIGITGGVATAVGSYLIGQHMVSQAQAKVALDINSARVIFEHEIERIHDVARLTANRFSIRDAIRAKDLALLTTVLRDVRESEGLDILSLADPSGSVIVRSFADVRTGDSRVDNPFVQRVLATRSGVAGVAALPLSDLIRENPGLASRARIAIVTTPRARPTAETELSAGMLILAAVPVLDVKGSLLGVLYGGKLLNRSHDLVDRIKNTVYRGEMYGGRELGTATLFLGDVRVATTVRTADGTRAIGTRVQAEVGDRILREGRSWTERAFVVDGWYLTAYEPILDLTNRVIGILYVGMREDKFLAIRRETVVAFLGVTAGGLVLAGFIAYLLARGVLRAVRRLWLASQEISAGNFEHRVPEISQDEFGGLERAFNHMTGAIQQRDREIRENAEARLIRSARLASLGQMAASIAHEVNNPLAGILIYLRLIIRTMAQKPFPLTRVEEMLTWLKSMEEEAARCGRLVSGMLQLGRQTPIRIAERDLNAIIDKTVLLLERRFARGRVAIARDLAADLPRVECDDQQIQQTLLGMLMNAFEAMPGGGTASIRTRQVPEMDEVEVEISDTGIGIPPENIPRLMDAFFTTKGNGKGAGLGLSIAHTIVRRHQGRVEVDSVVGRGSTFRVVLPLRHAAGTTGDQESGSGSAGQEA